MKSCLKSPTPPLSPYISEPPTPGKCVRPPLQKTVSFCADEKLEEVFEVEDWDRSPLPVAPKLSYEDVLELKQLRLSLPLPQPAAYASSPSNKPFPYSRFATQPSQTPSRWKNRGTTPSASLDPAILPYLDAVPIRLLPLLDTPQMPEPPSPQLLADAKPITRMDSSSISATSPLTKPLTFPHVPPQSAPPPTPASPATPSQPARRMPTFSFVPLLPLEPAPPPAPEPVRPPPTPQRRINMNFITLAAPPSPPPAPLPPLAEPTTPMESSSDVLNGSMPNKVVDEPMESELAATPTLAPIPETAPSPPVPSIPSSTPIGHIVGLGLEVENGEELFHDADEPEAYNGLPPRALSPTDLSTPALSSASESDTDEHDEDTDADEADRPDGHAHPALAEYEYFAARLQPSSVGRTPPLRSMYPNLRAALQEGEGAVSMSMSVAALKKVKLAALPSPALAPPSPFSLYPPTTEVGASPFVPKETIIVGERKAVVVGESGAGSDADVRTLDVDFEMGEDCGERTW